MTSQTKKGSKKTKAPPNESELADEFYAPQRAKSTRTAKPPKSLDSQDGKKDQDLAPVFCKNSIPFIDRHIFSQNSLETKEVKEAPVEIPFETLQITQSEENSNQLPPPPAEETIQLTQEIPQTPDNTPTILGLLEDQYHPDNYLFREKETKEILDFISKCIRENSYHSLLVSGLPGVGKTVVLKNLLRKLKENGIEELSQIDRDSESEQNTPTEVNVVNVNASYSETLAPIVLEIIKAVNGTIPLSVGDYKNNAKTLIDKLKQILLVNRNSKDKKLTVVFIDEVDILLSKQNLAKEIVELLRVPRYPSSNLIIILATNIPDLIVKLYDLHKIFIEAEQMTFEPYSIRARKAIIKNRLASDVIDPLELNLYEQLDLDNCIDKMELLNAKDTDPRHVLRIIRKALNKKKEAAVEPAAEGEDVMQIEPQNVLPELNKEDILKTYEELYDEHLSKTFSSLCQKHLLTLAAILSILAKKGGDSVVKKDVMSTYNTMCARLFLPKIDLVNLSEMLNLFEVYKVLELKPKEADATATPVKENIAKNTAKNANDEYRVLVAPEKIRNTLNQDGFFANV